MVRTRGLRWGLGRALGREVSGDEEEAPQRRRPTALARRQRVAAAVTEDIQHVDDAIDEAHEEPHNQVTKNVDAYSQDFPGKPQDTSVLISCVDHVAIKVWAREIVISLIITYLNFICDFNLPN